MNQTERIEQVRASEAAIRDLDLKLNDLNMLQRRIAKALSKTKLAEDVREKAEADMENIKQRIAAFKEKRHQAYRWIDTMKSQAAVEGMIRVINEYGKHAEIIILYAADNGKKISYTRHIHWDGVQWLGKSTVGAGQMHYRLPGESKAEAA